MNRAKFRAIIGAGLVICIPLSGCGTEAGDSPGQCSINCSKAVIAPNDYTIKKLTSDMSYRCSADAAGKSADTPVSFTVMKKTRVGDQEAREVPVPGISLQPIVVGNADTSVGAGSYKGIVTPASEFCTDSCGSITLTLRAFCPATQKNDVSLTLKSGSLTTDEPFKLSLESANYEETSSSSSSALLE